MDVSDQLQRLADTTYRNIEEFTGDMKSLVTAANTLYKAMSAVCSAAEDFNTILQSIGARATRLPGSVSKLGECLTEMVTGQNQINSQYANWTTSLKTEFITPIEQKLERDTKYYAKEHKHFRQETSKKESKTDKTASKIKSIQKRKISRENIDREAELRQLLVDQQGELHSARVEALRKALTEERKLYCLVVESLCTVVHNQIACNAVSHQALSTKVMDWVGVCSHPNELPPESATLLRNPRSPNAFSNSSIEVSASISHVDKFNDYPDSASNSTSSAVTAADIRKFKRQASPGLQRKANTQHCRMRAVYPHQATTSEQLEFNTGDLIDAVDDAKQGWLYGTHLHTGKSGWFPAQYVNKIWPTPELSRRKMGVVSAVQQSTPPAQPSPLSQSLRVPERDYGATTPPSPPQPPSPAAGSSNSEEAPSGFSSMIAAAASARKKGVSN